MTPSTEPVRRPGLWALVEEQLALGQLIREYMIPVEVNNIWYALGGVLAIALALEILTGVLLSFVYTPDAGKAYDITRGLIQSRGWSVAINFHYYNAYLIFALVMVHMMRVFVSGGYRRGKQALWLVGVALAGLTFVASLTGEGLHWDEVGFAVPWHMSEFFQAIGLAETCNYTFAALLDIPSATAKLIQIYALHVSIVPISLLLCILLHYYLIRVKKISLPFWLRASGRTAPFTEHIRAWVVYGVVLLGIVLLAALFVPRDPGVAPQLLPSSPLFGAKHGPGALGAKPTFPISWTHGMNVFVGEHLGLEPDIWGTVIGMVVMLGALLAVPFLDRVESEPENAGAAFSWRQRGWAFVAMILFWLTMFVGVIQNALAKPG